MSGGKWAKSGATLELDGRLACAWRVSVEGTFGRCSCQASHTDHARRLWAGAGQAQLSTRRAVDESRSELPTTNILVRVSSTAESSLSLSHR